MHTGQWFRWRCGHRGPCWPSAKRSANIFLKPDLSGVFGSIRNLHISRVLIKGSIQRWHMVLRVGPCFDQQCFVNLLAVWSTWRKRRPSGSIRVFGESCSVAYQTLWQPSDATARSSKNTAVELKRGQRVVRCWPPAHCAARRATQELSSVKSLLCLASLYETTARTFGLLNLTGQLAHCSVNVPESGAWIPTQARPPPRGLRLRRPADLRVGQDEQHEQHEQARHTGWERAGQSEHTISCEVCVCVHV